MEVNKSRMINLNSSNYHVWKGKMENLLYVKDYYLPVFAELKPEDEKIMNGLYFIKSVGLKYKDETPLSDHLNAYQGILNQLARMNIKFENKVHRLWLLGTLPDSWETFKTLVSNSAPNGAITMDLAKSSVLNEEMRRKSQGPSQSEVLVTEKKGDE
ncbi:hypothetical protein EZV62_025328 [Acer yangbiense]|uniref:Retrotransposon Copia-like N-terminal domain-containing protein n=1 Tax=Acer yangbiense TaxID=1000413 RepID=A0A5C7GXH3_9ROSI|nr:hypothetical protein EZV62_025328 [Acer yangbiense]